MWTVYCWFCTWVVSPNTTFQLNPVPRSEESLFSLNLAISSITLERTAEASASSLSLSYFAFGSALWQSTNLTVSLTALIHRSLNLFSIRWSELYWASSLTCIYVNSLSSLSLSCFLAGLRSSFVRLRDIVLIAILGTSNMVKAYFLQIVICRRVPREYFTAWSTF